MKYFIISITLFITISSYGQGHHGKHDGAVSYKEFKSEKITKNASIAVNESIEAAFPLFNPVEEQQWAPPFKPQFIYPANQTVQEGMSFKTINKDSEEPEFLWILTKYDTSTYYLQYLVTTPNRYWTIDIACTSISIDNTKTAATITYSFYALNQKAVDLNKEHLNRIFGMNLKDWESAINDSLIKK